MDSASLPWLFSSHRRPTTSDPVEAHSYVRCSKKLKKKDNQHSFDRCKIFVECSFVIFQEERRRPEIIMHSNWFDVLMIVNKIMTYLHDCCEEWLRVKESTKPYRRRKAKVRSPTFQFLCKNDTEDNSFFTRCQFVIKPVAHYHSLTRLCVVLAKAYDYVCKILYGLTQRGLFSSNLKTYF